MAVFPTMESILQENKSRAYSAINGEYANCVDALKRMMSPAVICGPGMAFATTYGSFNNWYAGAALGSAFAAVIIREIYKAEMGIRAAKRQLGLEQMAMDS